MKPRLLFVVNVDWFFMSHRLPVALAAQKAGYEVHVATVVTDRGDDMARLGLTVHRIIINRKSVALKDAWNLLRDLHRLFTRLRPDIVHLVTIKPVLLGGLAARWARVPHVVAAIPGLGFVFNAQGALAAFRRKIVSTLYRAALARAGVSVIFQNGDDQSLLMQHAGIREAQAVLIRGSGIDLFQWQAAPLPPGPPVVLMASRLLFDKGVREFVEAARLLRGHAGARFVLVGDVDTGNPTSVQRVQLEAWAKEGVIEWWGQRSDMADVLASAYLVVLPSYREGLPKVLIEAAARARAVVTTDTPGCRDAIEAGRTGLLVPPRDVPALAAAIRQLLDDPDRCKTMGQAGRQLAEQAFDIRQVIDQHLAIYQEAVHAP